MQISKEIFHELKLKELELLACREKIKKLEEDIKIKEIALHVLDDRHKTLFNELQCHKSAMQTICRIATQPQNTLDSSTCSEASGK